MAKQKNYSKIGSQAKKIIFLAIMILTTTLITAEPIQAWANTQNNYQIFSYNKPAYYGQNNYRYSQYQNYQYNNYNYAQTYHANTPIYSQIHRNPALMPNINCNPIIGCKTNYNSHITIRNALDYTYYKNPGLLEPRYMNNHHRYMKAPWFQTHAY